MSRLTGRGAARGESFRPTASRTHRKSALPSSQRSSCKPPLADISNLQKTGHFYFALTATTSSTRANFQTRRHSPLDFTLESSQSTIIDTHRFFILRIVLDSLFATFEWSFP